MATIRLLDKIKLELLKTGFPERSRQARKWMLQKMKEVHTNESAKKGFVNFGAKSRVASRSGLTIGKLYSFWYDPKTKDRLPYYDIMPMSLVIDYKSAADSATGRDSGFLGLNLHYLSPSKRTVLLDKLYTIATNNRFDERTKIRMSYSILVNNKKMYGEAFPCLKWYLLKYVKSRALEIPVSEYEMAVFLPYETFRKKSKNYVWQQSNKGIK